MSRKIDIVEFTTNLTKKDVRGSAYGSTSLFSLVDGPGFRDETGAVEVEVGLAFIIAHITVSFRLPVI